MASLYFYLTEGSRIFLTGWAIRLSPKRQNYGTTADQICSNITKQCYNNKKGFFQTSLNNFPQFWARDFAWCTKSLVSLGYKKQVHNTIDYALGCYQKAGKITTTISPSGKVFDFPYFAVDSLPSLMQSITESNYDYTKYTPFLNEQIRKYIECVIDRKTNLVRADKHFSSMKDFAQRQSSCYDNCMLAQLAKCIELLHDKELLKIPKLFSWYQKKIIATFYNGSYFYDDITKENYVAGDANVFPLITGVVTDKKIITNCISSIKQAGLDFPIPIKYTKKRSNAKFIIQEIFLRNYESTTNWTHMGILFTNYLIQQKSTKLLGHKYLASYKQLIIEQNGFPEVIWDNKKLFSTPFYFAETTMLWASIYLATSKLQSLSS